jgi:hypothetical protein
VTAAPQLPPLFADQPDPDWRPDYDRFRRRLAQQLDAEGHPDPHAAAAELVERALCRRDHPSGGGLRTSPVMATDEPHPTL